MKVFIATSLCLVSACDDLRKLSEKFVSIVISDIRTDLNWSEQLLHPLPLCSCEVLWSDWWRPSLTCDEHPRFRDKDSMILWCLVRTTLHQGKCWSELDLVEERLYWLLLCCIQMFMTLTHSACNNSASLNFLFHYRLRLSVELIYTIISMT